MRPHRLRMTAFGPFPGTVEVDLDRLAASGVFLLHGETGAGKSTLLDGLGYALYGRVPGVRQAAGRLRSDHAPAGIRTEVQLEVTLGGRRWRITRSPAQERAKARGSGTTTEPAKVLLEERRAAGWVAVSTRVDEAADELDRLLGMSADQFFQVVLLPQNDFARFLRADSKDRGLLLQRLFGTQRFRAVEDWLAARRVSTAGLLAAARQELQVLVARLAQAAGHDQPAEPPAGRAADPLGWVAEPPAGGAADPLGWGAAVVDRAAADVTAAAAAAESATTRRECARRGEVAAAQLADRQGRRRLALDGRAAVQRDQPVHDDCAAELRAAERAAEIAPVLADATTRASTRAELLAAESAARAALPGIGLPADAAPHLLRRAAEDARERAGRLDGLRALADDLAAERAVAASAAAEVRSCADAVARWAAVLAGLPARRVTAQAGVAAARTAAAALPDRAAALLAVAGAVGEARALRDVLADLAQLRDEHLLARETAVSLREKESELREARLTSMIAELAGTLEPGLPCEVCGSREHPDPYEGAGEGVSREDEERARTSADVAARQVADVEARLAAAGATAAGARARLAAAGQPADLEVLEQEQRRLAAEVAALRAAAGGLDLALADVESVEQEQARVDADLARARGAGDAARRRVEEAGQRAERLERRLVGELDGAPDLAAALTRADAIATACDDVLDAARLVARADQEADRAAAEAARAATAAGFAGPDTAGAALRPATWRAQAAARLREHDNRAAAVAAALADPELQVALDPPADEAGAADARRLADAALERAVGDLAGAQDRQRQVCRLAPQVDRAVAALPPVEEQAARVRRLADLCAGGGANALRMSLSSFVLAARLEDVAAAASGRLLRMSQGRYALLHSDGAAKGGARSGLGLLVRDSWTGRDRETSTLSGGETFQASLALALGLADVVQAESGGTPIEALFVDEGFGSLDDATLDEVMDVLDGLREGGRLVGLVSHVAELKARIPAQVHVRKGREGSTLTLEGC